MTIEPQIRKRPGWVWVISIFTFFSAIWTIFSFYVVLSGKVPLNAAQSDYLRSLTGIDKALTGLLMLGNLTGAIALFFLRKVAFYLFLISLLANLSLTIWHIIGKGLASVLGGSGFIGMIIGLSIALIVCLYTRRLSRLGVLQ